MALRGNLKDFSLPDVFQLVTFSRKTGVLRINRNDDALGSVWFRDGDVFFAQSNWHTEPLGERLVRAQRITPQALDRSLELRSAEPEDGLRLGQILVGEGYITEKVLEAFVQEQIQETIFDLMRWDEGEFDFEAMPEAVEEDIGLSVSIENIIMEGSRRLEEWNRIKKKIPSMDVVFKMATAPGEGTFEISLKPIEWNLLLLVDGTRSVAEMALETNRTDFEVARIIYGLFSAGLLEFAADDEIERLRAERREREALLAEATAAQRAIDDAAQAEAIAREAALEAQAESRAEAQVASAAAVLAAAVAESASADPVEEPGFLGAPVSAPTAQDAAALEEMMGAVLQQQPEPAIAAPEFPETAPYVPGEEPAFMSAQPAEEFDLVMVPVPSVEDLLPDLPEFEPAAASVDEAAEAVAGLAVAEFSWAAADATAPVADPEPTIEAQEPEVPQPVAVLESEPEPLAVASSGLEPEPLAITEPSLAPLPLEAPLEVYELLPVPALDQPVVPVSDSIPEPAWAPPAPDIETPSVVDVSPDLSPEPVTDSREAVATVDTAEGADDYERELMALGLGELPADLLGPIGDDLLEVDHVAPSSFDSVESPMSDQVWIDVPSETAPTTAPDAFTETVSLEVAARDAGISMNEIEILSASLDLPVEVPVQSQAATVDEEDALDFSELLESLDVGADTPQVDVPLIVQIEEPDSDFDEELLREVAAPAETGGVISTDAFLDDITIDDLGFSGGMTDELSALTGADRPTRPTTSINRIPDEGADGMLHRDTRVDKDTLLKIIDGIKNL